jgi:hypothetical protein
MAKLSDLQIDPLGWLIQEACAMLYSNHVRLGLMNPEKSFLLEINKYKRVE